MYLKRGLSPSNQRVGFLFRTHLLAKQANKRFEHCSNFANFYNLENVFFVTESSMKSCRIGQHFVTQKL